MEYRKMCLPWWEGLVAFAKAAAVFGGTAPKELSLLLTRWAGERWYDKAGEPCGPHLDKEGVEALVAAANAAILIHNLRDPFGPGYAPLQLAEDGQAVLYGLGRSYVLLSWRRYGSPELVVGLRPGFQEDGSAQESLQRRLEASGVEGWYPSSELETLLSFHSLT